MNRSWNPSKQRNRGRIELNTYCITRIITHCIKRLRQSRLVYIVLILTHSDRYRINLDQLGQRILKSTRKRNSATKRNINIWDWLKYTSDAAAEL
ncbi:hypothetical protein BT093_03775, partial [Corynebacterium diphtheriae]